MKRLNLILIAAVLLLAGCRGEKTPIRNRNAVPVKMATVKRQHVVRPVHTSGILHSSAEVRLSFMIGGIIDRIDVDEGARVKKGQILASLKLDEIEAQVRQARTGFEKAQRDFERAQRLYADNVVTQEQLQNAESGQTVAKSNLDIAEFNLRHARIAAPSDGRVLKKLSEADELIGAGYPVLLFGSLAQAWRVKTGVADRDVIRIFPGDSAAVRFDAYPQTVFPAQVQEISGAPDPSNGLFEIGLDLASSPKTLYSGFVASVDIFPSKSLTMWVLPFEALTQVAGAEGTVYRINPDSVAVRVPVRIAYLADAVAVIEDGLQGVSSVVTEGAAYLSANTKVKVVAVE